MYMLPACIPSSYPPNVAALMGSRKIDSGKFSDSGDLNLAGWVSTQASKIYSQEPSPRQSNPASSYSASARDSSGSGGKFGCRRVVSNPPPTATSSTRNTSPMSSPNSDQKTNDLTTEQCISDETITKTADTKHLPRNSSTTNSFNLNMSEYSQEGKHFQDVCAA